MKKAKEKQNSKGITLIALVVTIIILLILAGITITTLFGENGLITTANATKAQQELGKIKDIIGLSYLDTVAQGQGKASEEEILTEAFAKLSTAGYEVKTINSGESLKGIILQDTTGKNISEINLEQGKTTTIKISLDKQGGEAKNYVKVENQWYEITINNGIIQVSKEGQKELEGKAYTIKLTPPSTGATIKVGETNITTQTTIASGAEIEITAGETTGSYNFNITVEDTEFTINPTVTVIANPVYVTSITISPTTLDLEIGGDTAQLTATVAPTTATQAVTWHSSDEEVASVSETGLVTPGTKEGTATITAKSTDGRNVTSNECTVTVKEKNKTIDQTSHIGYYADIDDDGTVDGIIYADLAVGGSGTWSSSGNSTFSYPASSNLKNYAISTKTYGEETTPGTYTAQGFGTKSVVVPNGGTGEDRFYVMALKDFTDGTNTTFCWYDDASWRWDDRLCRIYFNSFWKRKEKHRRYDNKME